MLVLSRKQKERILIGDVIVTILHAGSGRAKIGIDAPQVVQIQRLGPANAVLESTHNRPLQADRQLQTAEI